MAVVPTPATHFAHDAHIALTERQPFTRPQLAAHIETLRTALEALERQAGYTGHAYASLVPMRRELCRLEVDLGEMDDDSARLLMRVER